MWDTLRARLELVMAEKLWRMDVARELEGFVRATNRELKDVMDVHHQKKDI